MVNIIIKFIKEHRLTLFIAAGVEKARHTGLGVYTLQFVGIGMPGVHTLFGMSTQTEGAVDSDCGSIRAMLGKFRHSESSLNLSPTAVRCGLQESDIYS